MYILLILYMHLYILVVVHAFVAVFIAVCVCVRWSGVNLLCTVLVTSFDAQYSIDTSVK